MRGRNARRTFEADLAAVELLDLELRFSSNFRLPNSKPSADMTFMYLPSTPRMAIMPETFAFAMVTNLDEGGLSVGVAVYNSVETDELNNNLLVKERELAEATENSTAI